MSDWTVLLGVLARVDASQYEAVLARLAKLPGVTPFSVDETGRMGVLLEDRSLDLAHQRLKSEIETLPGILGVWPVFCHADAESAPEIRTRETTHHLTRILEADVDGQHTS